MNRTLALTSLLAALSGATPALAQFEATNAASTAYIHQGVVALRAGATSRYAYVTLGSALTPGTPGGVGLAYWDSNGVENFGGPTFVNVVGAGSWTDGRSIQELANGDFLIAGRCWDPTWGAGTIMMRVDSSFTPLWSASHTDDDGTDNRISAKELANGDLMLVNPGRNGASSRFLSRPANGLGGWSQVYSDNAGAIIRIADFAQDSAGMVYGVGTLQYPQQFATSMCLIKINPASSGAPLGLWTYDDPAYMFNAGTSVTISPSGNDMYLVAAVNNITFPSSTVNTRVVKISLSSGSMAPVLDRRYAVDFAPANGAARFRPITVINNVAQVSQLVIGGSHHDSSVAKVLRVDTFGLTFQYGHSYGAHLPPYTMFASLDLDTLGNQVMGGSYRANAQPATLNEGFLVGTDQFGATNCSQSWVTTGSAVTTAYAARTLTVVPMPSGTVLGVVWRPMSVSYPVISLPGGPYCGTIHCLVDFNADGNADQDDVASLINVIAGGENPTGNDPDINRDGGVDQQDVLDLINAIASGGCP